MRPLLFIILAIAISSCASDKPADPDKQKAKLSLDETEITCPECGHKEIETLPTTACVISYDCKSCGFTVHPEGDDCCVFCSHGTNKCPSIQEKEAGRVK